MGNDEVSNKNILNTNEQSIVTKNRLSTLELGYDFILNDYKSQIQRFDKADDKANMLLVYNAALFTVLPFIFPFNNLPIEKLIALSVFSCLFFLTIITTLVTIIISIFPRTISNVINEAFINPKLYDHTSEEILSSLIKTYKSAADSIGETIEKKHKHNKITMCLTIVNVIFLVIMCIIKLF